MIQRAKHGSWLDDWGWVTFHKRAYHWQEMPVCHESLTSIIDNLPIVGEHKGAYVALKVLKRVKALKMSYNIVSWMTDTKRHYSFHLPALYQQHFHNIWTYA